MKIDHFQNMHLDRCMLSLIKKKKRKKNGTKRNRNLYIHVSTV